MKKEKSLYKLTTEKFVKEMIKQLKENKRKGDRDGWLSCTPIGLVLEVYYHTGKLQQAVKDNNLEKIKEYSADVANMSMMVLDKCGGLLPVPKKFKVYDSPLTTKIVNKKF